MTRHRAGTAGTLGGGQPGRRRGQGLAPADGHQLALLADARLHQAAVLEAARLARLAEELAAAGAEADDLRRGGGRHVDGLVGHLGRLPGPLSTSSPLTDSKEKRPLSQSQPWLTGSESMPSSRVRRFCDDCTATRQPTEQAVQVDST